MTHTQNDSPFVNVNEKANKGTKDGDSGTRGVVIKNQIPTASPATLTKLPIATLTAAIEQTALPIPPKEAAKETAAPHATPPAGKASPNATQTQPYGMPAIRPEMLASKTIHALYPATPPKGTEAQHLTPQPAPAAEQTAAPAPALPPTEWKVAPSDAETNDWPVPPEAAKAYEALTATVAEPASTEAHVAKGEFHALPKEPTRHEPRKKRHVPIWVIAAIIFATIVGGSILLFPPSLSPVTTAVATPTSAPSSAPMPRGVEIQPTSLP
jgi:hypothetical protein